MSAKLVAEEGVLKGLVLSMDEGTEWVIGRDPDECQLLIEDPAASRKQLVCRTSPDGIIIENLSTNNPVKVNGEEVIEPRLLKQGDTITIGEGLYRFYAEEGAKIMNQESKDDVVDKDETPHESIFGEFPPGDKGVLAEIDYDLRETGRWLLKVIGGPNNGAEFSMQEGQSYVVGTDPNTADVIFHDTSVSRQHARVTVAEGGKLSIEDLNSRNGTQVDGEPIKGTKPVETNTLISMGTTSFIIFDREGEMHTIISPLLPSIVKVLQRGEEQPVQETDVESIQDAPEVVEEAPEQKAHNALGAFILIGILTGLFVVIGIGTATLFQSQDIQKEEVDHSAELRQQLTPFPSVAFTYNKKNSSLLLIGHVLTETDKNQLLYTLQGVPFIKSIDDKGIIIDENVWREINFVLSKRPQWKAINVHSPKPGKFIISGYLKTRSEAEALSNYVTANFPYSDLLEWNIIVDENVLNQIQTELETAGIYNIKVELVNGEISLTGGIEKEKVPAFDELVQKFKTISGVRNVKNYVSEAAPEETMINLTNKYQVSGTSHQGDVNVGVVINGKILSKGDVLDGMVITTIRSNAIFLEKDGVRYRIDIK
jgi:type III secretion system YscD/HrpQ family protein